MNKDTCSICGEKYWLLSFENSVQGEPICECNLQICWGAQFIPDEKLQIHHDKSIDITEYITAYPVIPGTMTGKILFNNCEGWGYTFAVAVNSTVHLTSLTAEFPTDDMNALQQRASDDEYMDMPSQEEVYNATFDYSTSILTLNYRAIQPPTITVSYEYNP